VRLFHKSCGCNQKQEVGVAVGRKGLVQPEVLQRAIGACRISQCQAPIRCLSSCVLSHGFHLALAVFQTGRLRGLNSGS
jgi:hypothetical protein